MDTVFIKSSRQVLEILRADGDWVLERHRDGQAVTWYIGSRAVPSRRIRVQPLAGAGASRRCVIESEKDGVVVFALRA